MKVKTQKVCLLFLLCQLFCFLFGCNALRQEEVSTVSETQMGSSEVGPLNSCDQQLVYMKSLIPDDIQKLDIVYVRPENGGTRVYKTFTETSDVQAVLDILKDANLQTAENQEPQGGWTLLVRIWSSMQSGESAEPLLISSGGDTSIRIGSYAYTAKSAAYYTDLLAFFETSAAEEKPYTVSS